MNKPPQWIDKILEWFCAPALLEEVQGDLHELYGKWIEKYGIGKANRMYIWHVIKFLRPYLLRKPDFSLSLNNTAMLLNYFKIAVRNLSRYKTYVVINLLGMGFALACCIVAFLNLDYKLRFDDFHREKTSNVYRVNTVRETESGKEAWGESPLALGANLANDLTGIQQVMRLQSAQGMVKANQKVFGENLQYADMALLNVFNFPLLYGDSTAFQDSDKIVLDEETAKKYFGDIDPVGQEMTITDQFQRKKIFVVGAVTQKIPENTSILFHILVPISQLFEEQQFPESNWRANNQTTIFVQLMKGYAPQQIDKELDRYVATNNLFHDDFKVADFYLQPFQELAFTSDIDLPNWVRGRALNRNAVGFLVGITVFLSLLILLTACFNFTNTSIAFSSNRLKEIGVRKVIGGSRSQIIKQFLVENLVLCFLSIVIGLLSAYYLLDGYNSLFGQHLTMQYLFKSRVLIFLFCLPVITAILAGFYPAFKISKHQPAAILKERTRFASLGMLSKILLTAQFSFSCFALIGSIILTQNASYQQQLDYGYDLQKIGVTTLDNPKEFEPFRNVLAQNAAIEHIAGSVQIIGQSDEVNATKHLNDQELPVRRLAVGANYLQTTGIRLLEGRDFIQSSTQDQQQAVIINQKTIEKLHLDGDPINQQIYINEQPYQIIGLVKNHKEFGLMNEEPPCVFTLATSDQFKFLSISAPAVKLSALGESVMQAWFQVNPDTPFNSFLQQMFLFKQLHINRLLKNLCLFLAIVTLMMSAAGFFSIVSLNVLKRTKEIGIRKVFGGSVGQMVQLVVKDFVKYIVVAFVLGALLGYGVISQIVFAQLYTYHISVGVGAFILTLVIMFMVPGITVGLKVYRAAIANPSETLKYE